MTSPHHTPSSGRRAPWCAGLSLLIVAATALPAAAQRRARLSDDLASQLLAGSQTIDVIVDGSQATVDELARRYNLRVHKRLQSGGVLQVNAGQLEALQSDGLVDHLSGDTVIRSMAVDVTAETIGADQLWAGAGQLPRLTGRQVGVAVIDSGIDERHPALRGKVVASVDFTGSGSTADGFGHGTHVAGIIAARAGHTADTADLQGIAYGAQLINLRVLGDDGSGRVSAAVDAIDWTIANKQRFNIGVINLSLGAPVLQPVADDPLCAAVERAFRAGIVVVAAAGNFGRTKNGAQVMGGITTPGNSPYALTVGAIDAHATGDRGDDTLAAYSSKGPTRYDLLMKPDVVAPGTHIVSTEASGSYLQQLLPERHVAGGSTDGYLQLSGTSMSAAVVSGTAALLLDERRALRPIDVKAVLMASSEFLPAVGLLGGGAGSISVATAAIRVLQVGGQASRGVDSAEADWPNGRGAEIIWGSWGADTIIRGSWNSDSIIWGSWGHDCIIWGSSASNSIIWGSWGDDSIIWGSSASDSIIWGSWSDDSIIWGSSATDSIIWGSWGDDSIIWGSLADASIIWGS